MSKSVICDLIQIFKSSVSAVLPEHLIRKSIKYNPTTEQLSICGDNYYVQNRNIYVIGTGKAVKSMAVEVEAIVTNKIKQGIVSIPEGSLKATSNNIIYCEGAKNNLPDKNSENTSRTIKNLVDGLVKEDLLIVLVSGGGSALLSLPKPPVTLKEKTDLIKKLANSGADISELNTVRQRLSDIKGGKLAMYAQPATVVSLILSDIVGDPIDLIASGPTVENEDSPMKATNIISKYNLLDGLPDTVKAALKENEDLKPFPRDNVKNYVIGSNKMSIDAAVNAAKQLNYVPLELSNTVTGNIRNIAQEYVKLTEIFCRMVKGHLKAIDLKLCLQSLNLPVTIFDMGDKTDLEGKDLCLILGGEITIEVKGSGKGGRNQQLALEFSKNINEMKDKLQGFEIYFLSAGTDGIDGPTEAAGAIGYLELVSMAIKQNLNLDKYLEDNDSYNFYKKFDDGNLHVITGHTGTNVMDLHLIIIKKCHVNKSSKPSKL